MKRILFAGFVALSLFGGGSAIANEEIFCSTDAGNLLGDICVDAQGSIPDNADIRDAIVLGCRYRPYFVSENVTATFDAFWGEYHFCTIQELNVNDGIYFYRIGFDNSQIYRYNTSNESWSRLDVWEYSTRTGYLRGRLTIFTENGRALSTPKVQDLEVEEMYATLAELLATQGLSYGDRQALQNR